MGSLSFTSRCVKSLLLLSFGAILILHGKEAGDFASPSEGTDFFKEEGLLSPALIDCAFEDNARPAPLQKRGSPLSQVALPHIEEFAGEKGVSCKRGDARVEKREMPLFSTDIALLLAGDEEIPLSLSAHRDFPKIEIAQRTYWKKSVFQRGIAPSPGAFERSLFFPLRLFERRGSVSPLHPADREKPPPLPMREQTPTAHMEGAIAMRWEEGVGELLQLEEQTPPFLENTEPRLRWETPPLRGACAAVMPPRTPLQLPLDPPKLPSTLPHKEERMLSPSIDGAYEADARSIAEAVVTIYEKEGATSPSIDLLDPRSAIAWGDGEREWALTRGNLEAIPTPLDLETLSFEEGCRTEVQYRARQNGKGYEFTVKLYPKEEVAADRPRRNCIFLIDGSRTVEVKRYELFKKSVQRALKYLREGDSFNVLVASEKVVPLSLAPIAWSKRAPNLAARYLRDQPHTGYFFEHDPFSLLKIARTYCVPNHHNTVIFMTDGHALRDITLSREGLVELSQSNRGEFALFTAAVGDGNNLPMLDLMSALNGGEMLYSPTYNALPRKLSRLVESTGHFIARDLHNCIPSGRVASGVDLCPAFNSLYADRPYCIYGTTPTLEDFDLMIQGRASDHWIHIRQRISFTSAKEGGDGIAKACALQKAYSCYRNYLKNEQPAYLWEAERILRPIPSAAK